MELSWLDDFLALVDCGNFSRAADARHLTQPAFSRRIRALEDWAGTPLFDRSAQPVTLTEAGRRFRPFADETVRRLLQGREEARLAAQSEAATLRFAATHALSLTFFPSWLRALEARARLGAITLSSDSMEACERLMLAGQAQFLLCHAHPAAAGRLDAESFRSVVVGGDRLLAVTAPDAAGRPRHLLAARESGESAPLPHLSYSRESGMGRILEAVRAVQPLTNALDTVFTSHLAAVLRTLARDGRGVAWLPESLIAEDLARGTLVRAGVPAGDERWTVPVQIRLVRPRARQSKAAESFWTLAVEAALWRNAESPAESATSVAAPVAGAEPVTEKEL
ncbi:LysR family transcriptional regulator (plasmid) [Azospirillum oryzae]|uniref:LysR family transcriptional regulator n=1 Tax=Azospirillum oryzae TaxID=286727 RepID=A0A6N1AHR6_9PROT|nr:LysR family transcriptional regulator [Azospirillum oryzae]KAA0588577.1 LysR family transcriptional regulator [Azospirillum oryzae]QKS49927.1 LysR family transcriptional regulator [Azospirillum oryzae]GLR82769.1 LysR family transcriptional regulator [Azospirillum oryzae]